MTTGLLKRTVGGSLLGISLLLGYGVATQAQSRDGYWQDRNGYYQDRDRDRDRDRDNQDYQRNRRGRNWDQYGQYGGSFQARQTALNAGYNAGIKQGRKNRNRGYYRVDFWSFNDYRNADRDYNSRYGDKQMYQRYYREGFENGFNDGARGY